MPVKHLILYLQQDSHLLHHLTNVKKLHYSKCDIINKIQSCAIFFADITDNNANVSYEMGWARALKKKVIIVRRKGAEPPKSDYVNDTYHEYNDSARQSSLKKVIKENIIEELKKGYGLISEDEK